MQDQAGLDGLSEADLIVYQGLFLEGKMGDILGKLQRTRPVIAVGEVIWLTTNNLVCSVM